MSTFLAMFAFIFAGYLGFGGLAAAGQYDDGEARWLLRGSGALALAGVAALCWGIW